MTANSQIIPELGQVQSDETWDPGVREAVRAFLSCRKNTAMLRRLAQRVLHCPTASEDAVQEATLVILQLRHGPKEHERVRQWCCRVVAYVALHQRRAQSRRRRHEAFIEAGQVTRDPEEMALARSALLACAARVGQAEWDLLMQRYLLGEGAGRLAADRGISKAAVRMRLSRLRRDLIR